jgi:hypothetical protein
MPLKESMYKEPWSDRAEYPDKHRKALESELRKELKEGHSLFGLSFKIVGKREDEDDVLVSTEQGFFIVHLTWSGKVEPLPFPRTERFETLEKLRTKLAYDSEYY